MIVKKRCLLVFFMVLTFGLSVEMVNASVYTNYFGIEMTNQEYNTLLNLGFSEDEIYYMDETTFNENKELDATLVVQNEKYYNSFHFVIKLKPFFYMKFLLFHEPYQNFDYHILLY